MDYSFIIRKAQLEDVEEIQRIIKEAFKKYMKEAQLTGTMEALEESLEDIKKDIETKEVFIAIINNIPVGTIRVETLPDNTAYISRFGVHPDYHNIGVGKTMMDLVGKLLVSKGIRKVSLHTASKYSELMRFYYGRGFYVESTSKEKGYIRSLLVKDYE
ncbi:MAG: GNAT family N-acetyltransferase [Clostridium sp.]|jgi:ribosomal protein S18 acetylase RimI-like enzyme|nr:GNAT family N-acetyltransferase [Clostridium sp.]